MVVVRFDIGKDFDARNRDKLIQIRIRHAVDHRADAVVHNELVGDLFDRSGDLDPLAALVGDEQEVRDLFQHAAVDLLNAGFAVDNNIIKLAGEHRDDILQIGVDAAVAALRLRTADGQKGKTVLFHQSVEDAVAGFLYEIHRFLCPALFHIINDLLADLVERERDLYAEAR